MYDCTFVVFARAPVPGQVKTRLFRADPGVTQAALGRLLSAEDAARLHQAFVRDVLHKGQQAGFSRRVLYAADAVDHPALQRMASEFGYQLRLQRGADLGERMGNAITAELSADPEPGGGRPASVVLVGTDSPTLPVRYLRQAAAALSDRADIVIGPASDGGYYLIGMRRPELGLFAGPLPWGTDEVLARTLERLRALKASGRRPYLLPFFYDCDTPADLRLLRDHLDLGRPEQAGAVEDEDAIAAPATALVLRDLGLL
jgi:rSAM/selenodomain-associated transferase 1